MEGLRRVNREECRSEARLLLLLVSCTGRLPDRRRGHLAFRLPRGLPAGGDVLDRGPQVALARVGVGPLAEPGFLALIGVVLCYSIAFGLTEIGLTAYATEAGMPALAGVLLGLMSAGSAFGGLAYGSRNWRMPLARQFAAMLSPGCQQ